MGVIEQGGGTSDGAIVHPDIAALGIDPLDPTPNFFDCLEATITCDTPEASRELEAAFMWDKRMHAKAAVLAYTNTVQDLETKQRIRLLITLFEWGAITITDHYGETVRNTDKALKAYKPMLAAIRGDEIDDDGDVPTVSYRIARLFKSEFAELLDNLDEATQATMRQLSTQALNTYAHCVEFTHSDDPQDFGTYDGDWINPDYSTIDRFRYGSPLVVMAMITEAALNPDITSEDLMQIQDLYEGLVPLLHVYLDSKGDVEEDAKAGVPNLSSLIETGVLHNELRAYLDEEFDETRSDRDNFLNHLAGIKERFKRLNEEYRVRHKIVIMMMLKLYQKRIPDDANGKEIEWLIANLFD